METTNDIKALYMVFNAGFSDEAIKIARTAGAGGATVFNARGEGATHKSLMGITIDSEKEIVLSLVSKEVAEKIMAEIKEKMGLKSPANGICFTLPVENITKNSLPTPRVQEKE